MRKKRRRKNFRLLKPRRPEETTFGKKDSKEVMDDKIAIDLRR